MVTVCAVAVGVGATAASGPRSDSIPGEDDVPVWTYQAISPRNGQTYSSTIVGANPFVDVNASVTFANRGEILGAVVLIIFEISAGAVGLASFWQQLRD